MKLYGIIWHVTENRKNNRARTRQTKTKTRALK